MDDIVYIALGPFYAIGVIAVGYAASYAFNAAKKLDQSADETKTTETISGNASKQ